MKALLDELLRLWLAVMAVLLLVMAAGPALAALAHEAGWLVLLIAALIALRLVWQRTRW